MSSIKLYLLLIYCIQFSHNIFGEIILTEDRPYDVINIKVPKAVLDRALSPTPPILKAPVTIVVPIQVSQEEDDIENDEVVEEAPVEDVVATTIANDVVDQNVVVANDTQVANVTEAPILDEGPFPPEEEVQGQVFRFPCSCIDGQCGCCTGAILQRLNMKACGNISFVPEDFVFDVRLSVNNNTVVRQRVSASDPPPICFNPRRAPFVQVCAEISNIRIRNRNAFACLDITADIGGFPIYGASFRCFGLGSKGVQTGLKPKKPISSGPKPVDLFGGSESSGAPIRDSLIQGATNTILGGGGGDGGGIFGGSDDDDDDGGPFGAIGDAVGDLFGGRKL